MYRSRLQRIEEKRNLRKATLLTIGAVGLVILVVILGIPLLIRIAAFFGDLNASNSPVDRNDIIPPVPPQISLPYDATNSAVQKISGSSEPGNTIYLTLNGESAGDVVVSDDGTFSLSNLRLTSGSNTITAMAVDQAGNQSNNSTLSIFYSNSDPKLEITSPADRQQVDGKQVQTEGQIDAGTRLTINDRTVITNSEGKFSTNINLNPGENVLVYIATDRAGNQVRKELVVISHQ